MGIMVVPELTLDHFVLCSLEGEIRSRLTKMGCYISGLPWSPSVGFSVLVPICDWASRAHRRQHAELLKILVEHRSCIVLKGGSIEEQLQWGPVLIQFGDNEITVGFKYVDPNDFSVHTKHETVIYYADPGCVDNVIWAVVQAAFKQHGITI